MIVSGKRGDAVRTHPYGGALRTARYSALKFGAEMAVANSDHFGSVKTTSMTVPVLGLKGGGGGNSSCCWDSVRDAPVSAAAWEETAMTSSKQGDEQCQWLHM